jgi:branched-chain amino acid transport system substrate-binding protein
MKRLYAFALMVMALPLAGLSLEASAADCPKGKIKIYTSWPMQGAMLPEGTGMKNGVNLALDQN